MPSTPLSAVIFDLDGLLADTEPLWGESARLLLARRGHTWDPSLKPQFMGRHPLEVAGMLVRHYGLDDTPAALVEERLAILDRLYRTARLQPMPGARALVAGLAAARVPMAVASGSPGRLVQLVLERIDLLAPITAWLGSDAVERGKPAPDLFLLAARRLGVEPAGCVVLEDAPAGVQAALAAGMTCFAVPLPETPVEAVASAHRVLQSLAQLAPADLASFGPI